MSARVDNLVKHVALFPGIQASAAAITLGINPLRSTMISPWSGRPVPTRKGDNMNGYKVIRQAVEHGKIVQVHAKGGSRLYLPTDVPRHSDEGPTYLHVPRPWKHVYHARELVRIHNTLITRCDGLSPMAAHYLGNLARLALEWAHVARIAGRVS